VNATLRPGIATDALARASFAIEEQRNGYTIVRSPDRPDYWFGNCLVLDSEPSPASYEDWIQVHADAFAAYRYGAASSFGKTATRGISSRITVR